MGTEPTQPQSASRFDTAEALCETEPMKGALGLIMLVVITAAGCGRKQPASTLDPDIERFIAAKREQTKQTFAAQTNGLPNTVWRIFDAAEQNNFSLVTNLFATLRQEAGRFSTPTTVPGPVSKAWQQTLQFLGLRPKFWPGLNTEAWSPVHEVIGITEVCQEWDHKWLRRFGSDIIDSIPSNSIYFGGTDGGRFIVTALSESHSKGQPFVTLTQNALADGTYMDYLRTMYGGRFRITTAPEVQQTFQAYLQDAQRRLEKQKLKPGENVQVVLSRVQVSGQVAVMEINGLIVWNIFTNNPSHEFYVEESFPLDWMYPHLSPHGLILKVNREPLAELSEEIVSRDREYWNRYVKELAGDWLTPETSVEAVCEFGKKICQRKDLSGFGGDAAFARNEAAQKAYAKLRSAIGGVYAWRAGHAHSPAEKERMTREAELAFKQALALCPFSPETASRYVDLLLAENRTAAAAAIAQTLLEFSPQDKSAQELRDKVRDWKTTPAP